MTTFLGLLVFGSMLGLFAFLRWARTAVVHDATTLVPRSMPCLAGAAKHREDDWPDEAIDRLGELLESDEHEGAFV